MIELKQNIFRPLKTNWRGQKFGDNFACIDSQRKVYSKVIGVCPNGTVDLYKSMGMNGHNGEDWGLWRGEPLYFPVSDFGVEWKVKTEVDRDGGIGINIISNKEVLVRDFAQKGLVKNHPNGYYGFIKFKFWHLQKVNVHDEQRIKFGDLIGYGDSTGLSSGDHLHWSLKMCDVMGRGINTNNRYFGAMDFEPFFNNTFCLDILNLKQQLTLWQEILRIMFQIRSVTK